jgi:hypothetical protein
MATMPSVLDRRRGDRVSARLELMRRHDRGHVPAMVKLAVDEGLTDRELLADLELSSEYAERADELLRRAGVMPPPAGDVIADPDRLTPFARRRLELVMRELGAAPIEGGT